MRLEEKEFKGGFSTKNLFYLSVNWLNKDTFGQARLTREVTDAWCQKKFKHAGQEFTMEPPELSNQEIESIPGAKASLGKLDEIKFETLERVGDKMTIRSDEHKYWAAQTGEIGDTYAKLRDNHAQLITQMGLSTTDTSAPAPTTAETADQGTTQTTPEEVTMESLGKLEETLGVEVKTVSEISSVQLVLCRDGSIWLLSNQDKTLPKHQLLGGVGTGQWIPESDPGPGISFALKEGDRTLVQLDEASFASEQQGFSTLSLFKMLVRAEREKGITQHRVSFLTIERKQDGAVEAGSDGFDIKIKNQMKFRCMKDPRSAEGASERVSMKNFFAKTMDAIGGSQHLMHVFRYRFEKIGQSFKVQRPYVVSKRGISLKKDCPLKVCNGTAAQ